MNGTLEIACIAQVEIETLGGKSAATFSSLDAAGFGQVDIGPSGHGTERHKGKKLFFHGTRIPNPRAEGKP